jgi:hypothetical protein
MGYLYQFINIDTWDNGNFSAQGVSLFLMLMHLEGLSRSFIQVGNHVFMCLEQPLWYSRVGCMNKPNSYTTRMS